MTKESSMYSKLRGKTLKQTTVERHRDALDDFQTARKL